jgi:two-component system, NtrC family, response regulator AtoC
MSSALQAKLLHVLQDGEYSRLGARTCHHADVRVIAATNIDMERSIQEHTFREDLYYRLSAFVLHLPPLRERKEELGYLIEHFRQNFAAQLRLPPFEFDEEILACAYAYDWPGNLRELMNFIQRTTIFRDREIALADLRGATPTKLKPMPVPVISEPQSSKIVDMRASTHQARKQVERDLIVRTLNATGWNRKHAANRLNVSYKTLLCKIREYRIEQMQISA